MDIKDVELNLVIKSNKVTKVLHLLITDAIADFQNNHPKSIPSLLSALNKGDTEKATEKIDDLLNTVDLLRESLESVKQHIFQSMPPIHVEDKFGGKSFIDPDGNVVHKLSEKGDVAVIGGPDKERAAIKKTATAKKKAPAKKRATKKKAKKEEE